VRIHHLALLTPDPAALAAFYRDTLGLTQTRAQEDADGVRSVWLDLNGTILMVERGGHRTSHGAGLDGLLFAAEPGSAAHWRERLGERVIGRTAFTIYARDPDGNRFGVSSYPEPLGE
jgi:catechol 2,3-dioxygenase-like lactoylglutathione lyase family enzyme